MTNGTSARPATTCTVSSDHRMNGRSTQTSEPPATQANPAESDRNIAWTRESYAAMRPFVGSGRYVNYLVDDEPADSVAQAYGANLERLRQLKVKYDPANFFRMNHNIRLHAAA